MKPFISTEEYSYKHFDYLQQERCWHGQNHVDFLLQDLIGAGNHFGLLISFLSLLQCSTWIAMTLEGPFFH